MQRHPRTTRRRSWTSRIVTSTVALIVAAAAIYWLGLAGRQSDHSSTNNAGQKGATQSVIKAVTEQPTANAALQSLLETIAADRGNYAIVVTEPDGARTSTNGDKQYTAASTYKLFIAYGVFQQVAAGELRWTDMVMPNRTADECLRLMIVRSDNECPEAFGNLIGWQKIDDMMDRLGLHSTQVKFHDNITTANDLALYLTGLKDGTLLSRADSETLLGYMKQQTYRQGIPAGTGAAVADKPGFLGEILHDAGIVYGAQGPYVLVIMSDGGSWSGLADTAKQVHDFLDQ